ncbi:hypothetical protein J7L13_02455, partial [bacterium]|nr:hypothetical protein [bacterium]
MKRKDIPFYNPEGFGWQKKNRKSFLSSLHQFLGKRFKWYRYWHSLEASSFVHLGILIWAGVFFLSYLLPLILPFRQKGKVLGASWYDYSWQYRDTITIDNTQNPNTLTDYQVLLDEGEVG